MTARTPTPPAEARRRLRALRTRLPSPDGLPPLQTTKRPPKPFQPHLRAAADLEALNGSKWQRAEPRHLVALYAYLHGQVYKVDPEELTRAPLEWLGAVSAATKLLREEFGDDPVAAVEWVRWVWQREKRGCERRAKVGETSDFRITWRYMFCRRGLLVDYRRALAAAKERVR